MTTRNRKFFRSARFIEEVIEDGSGVYGTIRVKPSTVMWKPKGRKGEKPYYGVTISEFENWIMKAGVARKMKQ